jgi:hypothetical protein
LPVRSIVSEVNFKLAQFRGSEDNRSGGERGRGRERLKRGRIDVMK